MKQKVLQIHPVVENIGIAPIDNVTIEIRLPSGWMFATREQLFQFELGEPNPPDEPKAQLSIMSLILGNSVIPSLPWGP